MEAVNDLQSVTAMLVRKAGSGVAMLEQYSEARLSGRHSVTQHTETDNGEIIVFRL